MCTVEFMVRNSSLLTTALTVNGDDFKTDVSILYDGQSPNHVSIVYVGCC